MSDLIVGLYEDWLWLDERIETVSREIEEISQQEANCTRLMSIPGVGPLISTAVVDSRSWAASRSEAVDICAPCSSRRPTSS
jgi:transposase